MDYNTLIIAVLVISLASSASMAIIHWTRHTYHGFEYWVAGAASRVIAGLLFLLPRSVYPAWLTIGMANFMIIAETLCYIRGTLLFRGRAPRPWIEFGVVLAFTALFTYYIYFNSMMNMRIMVRLLFNGALAIWLIWILLSKRPAYFGIGDVWQASIWCVLAPVGFALAFYSIDHVPAISDLTSMFTPPSQKMHLLLLLGGAFMVTMSQIIMNSQRFEFDHAKLQRRLEEDVTSLQEMHDKLQMSEMRHRLLADNSIDVIWTATLEGKLTYVNPAVVKLRGFTVEEVMGKSMNDMYAPASFEVMREGLENARRHVAAGLPIDFRRKEIEEVCKDGSTVWTEITATGIYDNQGKFVEILGITRDISDRKIAEVQKEELSRLNHRLEKTESLARLAGAVAHHFNNKLMGVTGNLEVALSGLPDDEAQDGLRKSISGALDAAAQAGEVGTMMLMYLGEARTNPRNMDLSGFCEGVLSVMERETPKGVEMRTEISTPGPVVNADPEQIERIIRNLVKNAWEATDEKQNNVTVSVRRVKAGAIPSAVRFPVDFTAGTGEYACIGVSDTGTGIDAVHFEKLCDPFYSTKFTGRGIGLPVVLGIVRGSGGVITVQSQKGKGSVFSAFLPVS